MLFTVKNHWWLSLPLAAGLAAAALWLRDALPLGWTLAPPDDFAHAVLAGLGLIVLSDAAVQNGLTLAVGEPYLTRYRGLVEHFRPQGPGTILAGGLLAAAEELVFRGVLMTGLEIHAGLSTRDAILCSAAAFGLAHLMKEPPLRIFALWAVWEGVLLGYVYALSGSLAVTATVHALHDIGGFAVFALQRRTSWLMGR